jgi:RNA polymerase sigma-70 factor (ECF subfamily)
MDKSEFEALAREHWPLIQALARRFDSGAGAEDICQDVVLVAWRRREQLRDPAGFGPWVRQIALNVGRAHARRREGRMGTLQETDAAVQDHAQQVVDRCALENALAHLTDRERLTVEARHLLGWSVRDISAALEEPLGTTKSRLSRARGKLRQGLCSSGWTRLGRNEEQEAER